jgi:zinc transporter ZupT
MLTNINLSLKGDIYCFGSWPSNWFIFVIFAMGFIFGMLPLWIKSCRENSQVLSIINTFSGGIFLGLGFFHQLPEANEMLEDNPIQEHYPFTYLLAFITYSLILFIEKVATDAHNIADAHGHNHEENKKEEKKSNSSLEGKQNNEHNNIEKNNNEIAQIMLKANDEENNEKKLEEANKEVKHNILQSEENNINSNQENHQEVKVYTQKQINDDIKNEVLEGEKEKEKEKAGFKGLLEPIIVLCAIGFHGLFAGISIGIGEELNDTLIIIIAILAHKWAAALSLGVTFVKLFVPNKQFYILMTIFALITPVGTVIGLIVKQSSNELVEAIFLSVSSGTFFYLSMSEILVEEFEKKENKYIKFIVYVVGCLAISFLVFFE